LRPKNQEKEKKEKVRERLKKKLSETQKGKDEALAKQPNLGKKKDDGRNVFHLYSNSNDSLPNLEIEEKIAPDKRNDAFTAVDHIDESNSQAKKKRKKDKSSTQSKDLRVHKNGIKNANKGSPQHESNQGTKTTNKELGASHGSNDIDELDAVDDSSKLKPVEALNDNASTEQQEKEKEKGLKMKMEEEKQEKDKRQPPMKKEKKKRETRKETSVGKEINTDEQDKEEIAVSHTTHVVGYSHEKSKEKENKSA